MANGAAAPSVRLRTHDRTPAPPAPFSSTNPAGLWIPEIVSYEMLTANAYNWTMAEDLVFDIQIPDNAVQVTSGYHRPRPPEPPLRSVRRAYQPGPPTNVHLDG